MLLSKPRGNPMRWDCREDGCFNHKLRPKLDLFAECFERGVNFGDIDMVVENRGHLLFCEWKSSDAPLGRGQRLLHDALLRIPHISIIVIHGDAKTMSVASFVVRRGAARPAVVKPATFETLKGRVRSWWEWAEQQAPWEPLVAVGGRR